MEVRKNIRPVLLVSALLLSFLLSACVKPVDLKGFSENTATMVSTVNDAQTHTKKILIRLYQDTSEREKKLKKLFEEWSATRKAMLAVIEYSASIEALAESGDKGDAAVKEAGNALTSLATSIPGIDVGDAIGGVIDLTVKITGEIIKIKAATSLQEVVTNAEPAINKISELVQDNLTNLSSTLIDVANDGLADIDAGPTYNYYHYYTILQKREIKIINELSRESVNSPSTYPSPELLNKLELIVKQKAYLQTEAEKYLTAVSELKDLQSNSKELFDSAKKAVDQWAKAHAKIGPAIRKELEFNLVRFAAAVQSLCDSYQTITGGE